VGPELIVCDEPVSALDVSIQAQIVNLLADLQKERGIAYLFISHDLAVVRHLSKRIMVMYLGRIVELAEAKALISFPKHPYTLALLSAVPAIKPKETVTAFSVAGDPPSRLNPPSGCPFHSRCPAAQFPRCRAELPALREVSPGHWAACHFPV
jgi:oligopeptide/dipeptide ABC transporter ATP-binding protein